MDSDVSKVDVAYAKLKHLVTRYDLVAEHHLRIFPGEHLHIDDLSDRVGASATPVRQALERLHGAGLIDCIPKRGFFAKVPDAAELQELYEFALLALDHSIHAARRLIGTGRLELDFKAAMAPVPAHSTEGRQRYAIFIEGVSEQIVRLSRNGEMLRMIRNFHDRSHYVRCLAIAHCPDTSQYHEAVAGLIDLIRTGQIDSARAMLHAQMTHKIRDLPEIIRHARSRWAEPAVNKAADTRRLQPITLATPWQISPSPGKKVLR